MLGEFAPTNGLMVGGEVGHSFVQVALIEKQVIRVFQRHIGADLAQGFQSGSNMGLGLVFEKCFVTCLAQRSSSVHDRFGKRVERNAAIGSEIVGMARLPCARGLIWPDLIRSLKVSVSFRAISANRASIMPAAGFRFPPGRSVSIACACQYNDTPQSSKVSTN